MKKNFFFLSSYPHSAPGNRLNVFCQFRMLQSVGSPPPLGEGARVWVRAAAPAEWQGGRLCRGTRPCHPAGATDCAHGRGGGGTMRQKGICAPELRGRRGLTGSPPPGGRAHGYGCGRQPLRSGRAGGFAVGPALAIPQGLPTAPMGGAAGGQCAKKAFVPPNYGGEGG